MSARRRRAAASALGALLVAFFCAVLASSVPSSGRRGVLTVLALAWLVVCAWCLVTVVRTGRPGADPVEAGDDEPS